MKARNHTLSATTLVLVAAFAIAAPAQAKEGTWKDTFSGYGTFKGTPVGKERIVSVFEEWGLFVSNDNPMLDHLTYHLWGLGDFTKGVGEARFYLIATDPAGDQIVLSGSTGKMQLGQSFKEGSETLLGGTGKFAGITGSCTYLFDGNTFKAPETGTYFSHGTRDCSYKLP